MTCKDCIHYDVCAVKSKMHSTLQFEKGKRVNTDFYEDVEERCKHFSDKSRYIELPCKVGDTLFYEKDGKIACSTVDRIEYDTYGDSPGEDVYTIITGYGYSVTFSDVGKLVFLTREEAEKYLEED